MTSELFIREDLMADYRKRSTPYEFDSVLSKEVASRLSEGWELVQENQRSSRLRKLKEHSIALEDRVWTLCYRLGFTDLSGVGGFTLPSTSGAQNTAGTNQIDVVAVDSESAIAFECKSQERFSKRNDFQSELGKFRLTQERFTKFARSFRNCGTKRAIGMVMVVHNAQLSKHDLERAQEHRITILTTRDIEYYEALVKHLGVAARYQFLADIMSGREIPALRLTVPAIRTKMGKETAYSFSVSPEYLLKIGYISHRAKGKASDVDAYQRMVNRNRLKSIRTFIEEESNIFPTNIVVSLEGKVRFDARANEGNTSDDIGWLHLEPRYRSAWIIDGQHRLLAYAGSDRASTSRLSVLAFDQLSASKQAQLFVDINAKQKAVRTDLLHSLFAELHWNSDKIEDRIQAVTTKLLRSMDEQPDSPLFQRVVRVEGAKDSIRCLTVTELSKPIVHSEFFMGSARKGRVEKPGIFWADDNSAMLDRASVIVGSWLSEIRDRTKDWWELGAAPGGGLAMNDGVVSLLMVLRSVVIHLRSRGIDLYEYDDAAASAELLPYAELTGSYLASLDFEGRQRFRKGRGVQGTTNRMRRIQQAIRNDVPEFDPPGLAKFLEIEAAETNTQSKVIIDRLERMIQTSVIDGLQEIYRDSEKAWWWQGVPKSIRVQVSTRMQEDNNSRGGEEHYFNLIDYRRIVLNHWTEFQDLFGIEKKGNKDSRTSWMSFMNDIRNAVSHASSGKTVTIEELDELREIEQALRQMHTGESVMNQSMDSES